MPLIDLNDPKKNKAIVSQNTQSEITVGNDPSFAKINNDINNVNVLENNNVQPVYDALSMQDIDSLGENMNLTQTVASKTNSSGVVEYETPQQNIIDNESDLSQDSVNDIGNNLEERIKENKEKFIDDQSYKDADLNTADLSFQSTNSNNFDLNDKSIDLNLKQYDLADILLEGIEKNASDIHLSVGHRAIVRVNGKLETIPSQVLTTEMINEYIRELIKSRNDIKISEINQIDVGYTFRSRRLRVNIFKQMGNFSIVARIVPGSIKSIDEMGLPAILKEFADIESGFILVTGPTGSGKSTTLAATLNNINAQKPKHIITLEDPIEFVFPKMQSLIDQREYGLDFKSWGNALRSMLRQDPDIVLVGEMRDLETISSAITVAETGHLVFSTLHTNSASQTIDRIIDVFPVNQQPQIRAQLANVITAVISQRLVPTIQGGRRAVMEIMVATPAIKNAIREGKAHQIDNMIQTGQDFGMYSLEKSLINLVKEGVITEETAKTFSSKPEEIEILLGNSQI